MKRIGSRDGDKLEDEETEKHSSSSTYSCFSSHISSPCPFYSSFSSCLSPQQEDGGKRSYELVGQTVCFRSFCSSLGIGRARITKLLTAEVPPEDKRSQNGRSHSRNEFLQVDSFMNYIYEMLAEPLAETSIETCLDLTLLV
jgi:hypothetical protein